MFKYTLGTYPLYDVAGNEIIGWYCKKYMRKPEGWKIFVNEKYSFGNFWLNKDVFYIGCENNHKYIEFVKNPDVEAAKFMGEKYDTVQRRQK